MIPFCMSLVRKVRRVGSSLIVTIPSHIATFYEINEGTYVEFVSGDDGKILLKKVIE